MLKIKALTVTFIVALTTYVGHAQNNAPTTSPQKDVTHGNQQWIQYYNQTKLTEKWSFLLDGGFRWKDGFDQSNQYIVRTGMRYNLTSSISVAGGYAHLGYYSNDKINKIEHRIFQELQIKNKFEKFGLTHKYRLEERFFKPVIDGSIQSSHTFNYRFRYSIMASIPLFNLSKNNPDSKFLMNIGDELFINAGSEITNNVFDQNRLIISPTFQLSKALDISLTWSSMYAGTINAGKYNSNSVFWLQIKHNLDLSRKKIKNEVSQ